MTPQTIEETDVEVAYALDDAEEYGCQVLEPRCSNEAVRITYWTGWAEGAEFGAACGCNRAMLLCLPCLDKLSPAGAIMECAKCARAMQLSRSEAIR